MSDLTPVQRHPARYRLNGWTHFHRLYRGRELLIETVHKGEGSLWMEVHASNARIARHEATHVETGEIPS